MELVIDAPTELIYNVSEYCVDQLNIPIKYDIIITQCCLKHDNAMGWTYDIADNEIDIELDENLSEDDMVLTLCHEMVHALQAARGDEKFCEIEANKLERRLSDGYKMQTR